MKIYAIIRKKKQSESRALIRKKIKIVIKRYSAILTAMKKGKNCIYVRRLGGIIIDEEIKIIIEIIREIIENERVEWIKTFYRMLLNGDSDIRILIDCPVERGKYYQMKKSFFNKIYECCIYKGLVSYEDILNVKIG